MTVFNSLIVIYPMAFVIWLSFYSKRYARDAVDYLATRRVAGRHVMATGNLVGCLSAITPVVGAEKSYQAGFGMGFWGNLTTPIMIVMALTGYCIYRWIQTRCLSKWQFIEMRYGSRTFRLMTTIISPLSKIVTSAIGPAIATYFSLYYLFLHSLVLSPQSGFQSKESKTAPSFL